MASCQKKGIIEVKGNLTEEIQAYHGGLRPRELCQDPISASVIVSLARSGLLADTKFCFLYENN